ncbi:hypothetical protein FOXG_16062 [Fusarium oxysporum f. sp. lycopersici 4287]|uniref:Uncharacterized protein n=2 Tax=Fusarium oxysporum TaxID=5507 RepID=A0A0J9W5R4_FUSO4|nr:hypothetical protein FOXG_15607 [Fusarium oxysporum f. sp. lycopersici 4287]XP_018256449.1 uncharacterized protein FOXG_16062 [Fusarium oxysporum f. sp. lycopersici 4287]KNB17893.1 hypothetical protein FOXG_15607 [Fusarium oxysporum f. sp. lycopersici 4287]KNB18404.1 hypothetical protein FOXG_16062 [Fusarium oxysporum f. sp. lycopersici 4287]
MINNRDVEFQNVTLQQIKKPRNLVCCWVPSVFFPSVGQVISVFHHDIVSALLPPVKLEWSPVRLAFERHTPDNNNIGCDDAFGAIDHLIECDMYEPKLTIVRLAQNVRIHFVFQADQVPQEAFFPAKVLQVKSRTNSTKPRSSVGKLAVPRVDTPCFSNPNISIPELARGKR